MRHSRRGFESVWTLLFRPSGTYQVPLSAPRMPFEIETFWQASWHFDAGREQIDSFCQLHHGFLQCISQHCKGHKRCTRRCFLPCPHYLESPGSSLIHHPPQHYTPYPIIYLLSIPPRLFQLKGELRRKIRMLAHLLIGKFQSYLYLIHFLQNTCNLLIELKSSLVIDKLHKKNCGKPTGIEQTSVERQKVRERKHVFFLSLCHKTRPL